MPVQPMMQTPEGPKPAGPVMYVPKSQVASMTQGGPGPANDHGHSHDGPGGGHGHSHGGPQPQQSHGHAYVDPPCLAPLCPYRTGASS